MELNEAFSPQAVACVKDFADMGIDPERVNPMGNAIALGHPLGATGAVLTLTCAYALRRNKARYGLVTMRERAEGVGGRVSIESGLGKGTIVTAEVPLAVLELRGST